MRRTTRHSSTARGVWMVVLVGGLTGAGCARTHGRGDAALEPPADAALDASLDALGTSTRDGSFDAMSPDASDAFDETLDAGPLATLCDGVSLGSIECLDRAFRALAERRCARCGTASSHLECVEANFASAHQNSHEDVEILAGVVEVDLAAVACLLAPRTAGVYCDPLVRPTTPGAPGDACLPHTCGADLFCDVWGEYGCSSTCSPSRTRVVRDVPAGASCAATMEDGVWTYRQCVATAYCRSADSICETVPSVGEPCTEACLDAVCQGGVCVEPACPESRWREGDACEESGSLCGQYLFCERSTCVRSGRRVGDACSSRVPCLEGFCREDDDGLGEHCVPLSERVPNGASCVGSEDCAAGTCCHSECVALGERH